MGAMAFGSGRRLSTITPQAALLRWSAGSVSSRGLEGSPGGLVAETHWDGILRL